MNIAFFSHYFSPEIGAPSARIHELSRQWIELGHRVEVVTCFPNHPDGAIYPGYELKKYQHEVMDEIHVHRNWTYITPNKGILKRTLGHVSFWLSSRLFSSGKLRSPDIAIGTSPTFFAPMAALGTSRSNNIPFVMEVRDLWPGIFVDLGIITNKTIIKILEAWELWMYQKADLIVTVTDSFRENIINRGIDSSKVLCIPNGADVEFWKPLNQAPNLETDLGLEDKFVVLYIGAHGVSQALSKVLESAQILENQEEIIFLFVGSGSRKKQLIDLCNRENISNVVFHDPVSKEKVKEFYELADLCLVPLRDVKLFRTFIPSKIFEILAMGKPIVASVEGEAKEILLNSGAAIIVPPENSQKIAEAILLLRSDPERRKKMSKRGRQFVTKNYARGKLAEDYLSILQTVIT